MRTLPACLLFAAALAFPLLAEAQGYRDPLQAGAGAYSAGRHEEAEKQLTLAIDESPRDPRGYYYRGLARLAQGKQDEGMEDLRQGATLELAAGYSYAVIDRALASVQGQPRRTIEQVRQEMRRAAEVTRRTEIAQARRAERERREQRVLRVRHELPLEALANQLTPDQALAAARKSRGTGEEYVASIESPANALAQSQPAETETDPFAAPDEGDPFATDDEEGEELMAEAPAVAANPDSPFAGNPFLEGNPQAPAPQTPPVAGGAPAAGDGPSQADVIGGAFRFAGKLFWGGAPDVGGMSGAIPGGFGGQGSELEEPEADGEESPFGVTPDESDDDQMSEEEGEPEPDPEMEEDEAEPANRVPIPGTEGNSGAIGGGNKSPFSVE